MPSKHIVFYGIKIQFAFLPLKNTVAYVDYGGLQLKANLST